MKNLIKMGLITFSILLSSASFSADSVVLEELKDSEGNILTVVRTCSLSATTAEEICSRSVPLNVVLEKAKKESSIERYLDGGQALAGTIITIGLLATPGGLGLAILAASSTLFEAALDEAHENIVELEKDNLEKGLFSILQEQYNFDKKIEMVGDSKVITLYNLPRKSMNSILYVLKKLKEDRS